MPDVFNNPSNDYINPGLAPCTGVSDSAHFEFINDGGGVVSGAEILQFMDLSNINIPITEWLGKKKTLLSGEVIFVPGLTKGLLNRTQLYDIDASGYVDATSKYFMILDISINYYNNFRYFDVNIEASANYTLNIDIDDAMNIALGEAEIDVTLVYDPCVFTFTGDTDGYEFNVTNTVLTIIDTSNNSSSPFTNPPTLPSYTLIEDASLAIPAAKYPNGAMQGYLLKAIFPSTESAEDSWLYINNVESPFEVYESLILDSSRYERFNKIVDVGRNTTGTSTTLSAGEYLDYINTHNLWNKFGAFASRISGTDPANSNIKNLVGGFYVFNPQVFPIKIEYILIN